MSRWRACASHGSFPLLVTVMQNWPSLRKDLPSPGGVNNVVHGRYVFAPKSVLPSSSLPDSLGTSTPGEPLVGAAFQSAAVPTSAAAAGGIPGPGGGSVAIGAGADGAGGGDAHANEQTSKAHGARARRFMSRPRAKG